MDRSAAGPPRKPRPGRKPARRPGRRSARRRVAAAVIGVLALTASAVACAAESTTPTASSTSSTPTPTPTPPPPPPPPPPPVYWPLTGIESGEVPARPALAVKIENAPESRPQTGLNAADMVWEEVVEGGITRFVAVYHSTLPPEIGPVRSVRPMDPAIAAPLHGLFAFSGGQRPFVDAVAGVGLQVLSQDAGAAGFYRVNHRYAPHNVYADPAVLLAQADPAHQAAPPGQFVFAEPGSPPTAAGGGPTPRVSLKLSALGRPSWTWDPAGTWVRAERGVPALEAGGAPVRAANVVALMVDVVNTPFVDPAGTPVPETVMVGTGQAYVASAGHTLAVTWTKNAPGEPVSLTTPDGQPVRLARGTTWVELVPNRTGSVTLG